jgi:hypothetical protein
MIQRDRPEEFFVFGPNSKRAPWITTLRSWDLIEPSPPKTLASGYFLLREFDNTMKEIPYPQHWTLVGFYGKRENIPKDHSLPIPTLPVHTHSLGDTSGAPQDKIHFDTENLSPEELQKAKALAWEYRDVFRTDDYPRIKDFQMRIETGDATPVYQYPNRYSPLDVANESAALDQMRALDVIEPGYGSWSSRRVSVRKPDGTYRECVDYRALNLRTKRSLYAIPRMDTLLDHLHGAQYISTNDMFKGYWQIEVHPDDRDKTAFLTRQGLFRFKVMPFGLINAPAVFQRLMDNTLQGLLMLPR